MRRSALCSSSPNSKQNLSFCIIQMSFDHFSRHSVELESCNMVALVAVCHNSNPLFCASRKSNQYTAWCKRHHFNLYACYLGWFGLYRGVSMDGTMESTAVMNHVCRPYRTPIRHATRDLLRKWTCNQTLILRDKNNQSIRAEKYIALQFWISL